MNKLKIVLVNLLYQQGYERDGLSIENFFFMRSYNPSQNGFREVQSAFEIVGALWELVIKV